MRTKKNRNGVRQPITPIGLAFDIVNSLFMIALFIVMAYPFIYVISYSLSTPAKITNPLVLWPQGFTVKAYATLFGDADFYMSMFVSVARTIIGPLSMMVVCGMGAYALSKKDLVFGKFLRMLIFFTMYFSAGVVPVYLLIKNLGLTRSFWVYILPGMASAYNVVLLRTYIESLPRELDEAVQIDGGNEIQSYFLVIFRVCLPVNAAVILFSAISNWNSYIDTQFYNSMDSCANFIFVSPTRVSGKEYFAALREKGILARFFDAPRVRDFVRVTIGSEEQMEAFLKATREILEERA